MSCCNPSGSIMSYIYSAPSVRVNSLNLVSCFLRHVRAFLKVKFFKLLNTMVFKCLDKTMVFLQHSGPVWKCSIFAVLKQYYGI
jgi:hypothetical protein